MIDIKVDGDTAYMDLIPVEGQFTLLDVNNLKQIISALRKLQDTPAKVIRIYGHGGCFAVGADLKTLHTYTGFDAKWFSKLGNTLFGLMRTVPQVIIGEIDGFCMGGGVDFASACDIRVATAASRFAHPGSKLGLITGFGGTQSVIRLMKSAHANRFFLSGNVFEADFMLEAGFLSGVYENRTEMRKAADRYADKINRKPRQLLSGFKSSLDVSKGIS